MKRYDENKGFIKSNGFNSYRNMVLDIIFFKRLIDQNSHTRNKAGVDAVGAMIAERLRFMKCETVSHEIFGDLLVFRSTEQQSGLPRILLSGHSDTVFSEDDDFAWHQHSNDMVLGPGTFDMKGGLMVIIHTLETLHEHGDLKNITFTLIPDEEMGSGAHQHFLHQLYKDFTYAFVFEGDRGGEGKSSHHEKNKSIVLSRRGFGSVEAVFLGPGGHSGNVFKKEERSNTIQEAAYKVGELIALSDYEQGITVNPGVITGGTAPNVIPNKCELVCEFRVSTMEQLSRMKHAFEQILAAQHVAGVSSSFSRSCIIPPMQRTSEIDHLFQHVSTIGKSLGLRIDPEERMGGSDANQIGAMGVPVLDGFGPQGKGLHTHNEFVFVDSFSPAITLTTETIRSLLS